MLKKIRQNKDEFAARVEAFLAVAAGVFGVRDRLARERASVRYANPGKTKVTGAGRRDS